MPNIIPYFITLQILIGLCHAAVGVDNFLRTGIYDYQTVFLLILSIGTLLVHIRLKKIPVPDRSLGIIFEHAVFMGGITWLFCRGWGIFWEVFLVAFISVNLIFVLLVNIFEREFKHHLLSGNFGIPDFFWKLGSILTLINTITLPLLFIFLHENLSSVWIFYGINWIFLWKDAENRS